MRGNIDLMAQNLIPIKLDDGNSLPPNVLLDD